MNYLLTFYYKILKFLIFIFNISKSIKAGYNNYDFVRLIAQKTIRECRSFFPT